MSEKLSPSFLSILRYGLGSNPVLFPALCFTLGLVLGLGWVATIGLLVGVFVVQRGRKRTTDTRLQLLAFVAFSVLGSLLRPNPETIVAEKLQQETAYNWLNEKRLTYDFHTVGWPLPSDGDYLRVRIQLDTVRILGREAGLALPAVLYLPKDAPVQPEASFRTECACRLDSLQGGASFVCSARELVALSNAEWITPLYTIGRRVGETLRARLPSDVSGVAVALLTGDRRGLRSELREQYRNAGGAHLLAISGQQITLVLSLLLSLLLLRNRLRKRMPIWAALLAFAGMAAFALVAGLQPPVLRALLMGVLALPPLVLGWQRSGLNMLATAWLLMLCWRPEWVMDIGFQLSFAAMLGMLWLLPWHVGRKEPRWKRYLHGFASLLIVSIGAQLCTTPVMLAHFGQLSFYAVLTSVLTVPIMVAILPLTIALALTPVGFPLLDDVLTVSLTWLVRAANTIVTWVASLPSAAYTNVPVSTLELLGFASLLILIGGLLYVLDLRIRTPKGIR
jgi:ComEC/Rec2-related protein